MNEISIGQRWVYAIGDRSAAAAVDVLELQAGRGGRVKVRFAESSDAGADEWVHPSRLKALWVDRETYFHAVAKWRELASIPDSIEEGAVCAIFREFIAPAATVNHGKVRRGTVTIYDFDLADVFIGGSLEQLLNGVPSLEETTASHYAWPTAVALAQALCRAKPQRVLAYVHAEEVGGQARATGREVAGDTPRALVNSAWESTFYEDYIRPMCDLLRSWCGEKAASIQDELHAARLESARLARLVDKAVVLLERAGAGDSSRSLYLELYPGVEESRWRSLVADR